MNKQGYESKMNDNQHQMQKGRQLFVSKSINKGFTNKKGFYVYYMPYKIKRDAFH